MVALGDYLRYETRSGQPVETADHVVTPISRVLSVTLPFYNLVWNRPVAIVVEQGTSRERVPIVNVMLLVQILVPLVGLAAAILALLASRIGNKR